MSAGDDMSIRSRQMLAMNRRERIEVLAYLSAVAPEAFDRAVESVVRPSHQCGNACPAQCPIKTDPRVVPEADPCAGGCDDPVMHAEGGHDV